MKIIVAPDSFKGNMSAGEACAVVESVKAASDVYAPLTGKVVESNPGLVDDPALANAEAEGKGWFFRVKIADIAAFQALMDRNAYDEYLRTLG